MKRLIIDIFKTLFFFDLAVIIISILPVLSVPNAAISKLIQEALFLTVPLILSFVFYLYVEKRNFGVLIGKKKIRSLIIGLTIGIIPISICVGILKIFKGISFNGIIKTPQLWLWLLALLFSAIANELLLRGYLFNLYKKNYGIIFATVVTTLFYITLNLDLFDKSKLYIANILLFNILLCLLLDFSGSVITTITTRFTYSAISSILFGGLYSKNGYPTILNVTFSHKTIFIGEEYRFEGSIITLFLTILIIVYILIKKYNFINVILSFINFLKKYLYIKKKSKY